MSPDNLARSDGRRIQRYLDGQMPPDQARDFQQRIRQEPALAQRVDRMRRLDARVLEALAGETCPVVVATVSSGPTRWIAAAGIAAALAITVSLSIGHMSNSRSGRQSQPPTQAAGTTEKDATLRDGDPEENADPEIRGFEVRFGEILGIFDPESREVYLFEKTDRVRIDPRVQGVGI